MRVAWRRRRQPVVEAKRARRFSRTLFCKSSIFEGSLPLGARTGGAAVHAEPRFCRYSNRFVLLSVV
jgi:hypothetical protein